MASWATHCEFLLGNKGLRIRGEPCAGIPHSVLTGIPQRAREWHPPRPLSSRRRAPERREAQADRLIPIREGGVRREGFPPHELLAVRRVDVDGVREGEPPAGSVHGRLSWREPLPGHAMYVFPP